MIKSDLTYKHSNDNLSFIIEAIPIPVYVWEQTVGDFRLICMNEKALKTGSAKLSHGIEKFASELLGVKSDYFTILFEVSETKEKIERMLQMEEWPATPGKYTFSVLAPNKVLVAVQEVPQAKPLESSFQEQYLSLIENISETILLLDENLKIIFQSPANKDNDVTFSREFPVSDRVHPDDLVQIYEVVKSSLGQPNVPIPFQARVQHILGSYIWIEGFINNMFHNKNIQAFIVNYRNITDRKLADEQLKQAIKLAEESQFRLKEAQKSALIGSWELNLKTFEVIWSEETYSIFDLDYETFEASHEAFLSFIHPDDRVIVDQAFEESLLSGQYHIIEHRVITKNNTIKYIEERWRIVINEDGLPIKAFGTSQDITERKKIQLELIDQEVKYRALFESSTDSLVLFSDGVWVDCNTSTTRLFGCSKEELLNKSPDQFCPEFQPNGNPSKIVAASKVEQTFAGEPQNFEWVHCKSNGELFIAEINLNRIDFNGKPHILAIIRDITANKKAQEQLALASLIINSSEDAIFSKTINGIVTSWNLGAEKILGYTSNDAIGMSIYDLIEPSLHDEEKELQLEIALGRPVAPFETKRIRKDGQIINVSLSVSPIINEEKLVIGSSVIMRDISEKRKLESEKAKVIEDLIQRNRDLEQFSFIVSHNLRAPVANIIGISEFLLEGKLPEPDLDYMLKGLSKSVGALDSVIRDLNYILQKRHQINEKATLVNFASLVEEIHLSIANLVQLEKVVIHTDFEELASFNTIKSYIYSIFYNLISNSIKYKRPNLPPTIFIASKLTETGFKIIFKDNGLGIDLAQKGDQIFGLYKRFHFHTDGKGMGLYMVKSQVETLGGKIFVRSEMNVGTEFTLEFSQR
jgi:PAS domain S-box-containing protein